jgi:small subunit ribosomal protein S6
MTTGNPMERRQDMREYELYVVIDADAEEETVGAIIERVSQLVSVGDGETGGEVIKVDPKGKRRLAYPVNKKTESQDIIFTLQTPPQALPEIERFLKLDEDVLRYLLVRTDEG